MERTRIADMADRLCSKLSKGYRQRVGLAQAIIHNPDVLILDEPTAGLDPKQIIETRELIKELAGNHTIILSTHILPEVSQTCERVVIINKGKVVADDTPDNLTARAARVGDAVRAGGRQRRRRVRARCSVSPASRASPKPTGATRLVGYEVESEHGRDVRRDLARAVVNGGWGLLEMRPTRMSLEEIFLSLTTDEAAAAATLGTDAEGAAQEVANA